jgi:GNAT superfamily N-acetyltransferase
MPNSKTMLPPTSEVSPSPLTFVRKTGRQIADLFDELAQLRIRVFRDFPYCYDGTVDYEKTYLQTYAESERAFLFAAYDGARMIGATTAIPLADETRDVQKPFVEAGYDLSRIFYFGESVLLPAYRGRGLGHRFFDEREAHAASFGQYEMTCFCAVVRPDDHPLRPPDYRPLDEFWLKRGYRREPRLRTEFSWTDIGDREESPKPMVYWLHILRPAGPFVT